MMLEDLVDRELVKGLLLYHNDYNVVVKVHSGNESLNVKYHIVVKRKQFIQRRCHGTHEHVNERHVRVADDIWR
jgi:hypothetical protein